MNILTLTGNTEIKQFVVTEPGFYMWRSIFGPGQWITGYLLRGDRIDDQYEGCGPVMFEVVKVKNDNTN